MTITRGIRIVEKPTFNETNWRFWNLRPTEEDGALGRSHWLTVEEECEWQNRGEALAGLAMMLRNAMLGCQLWGPKGWDGLIVSAKAAETELQVESVTFSEPYPMSQWGKMMSLEKLNPVELGPLVEGTLAAFESGTVRAINPFQFLEIGLQTAFNHRRAGALMWTMGLDGLLAAEKQALFASRLVRLLGRDTPVFPEDWVGRRPVYTVGEVAASMFDLRGLIAHGKEILEKYRAPITFRFEPPELQYLSTEKWDYETLLVESAFFTLIGALRKLITSGLLRVIADKRSWERWLDSNAGDHGNTR